MSARVVVSAALFGSLLLLMPACGADPLDSQSEPADLRSSMAALEGNSDDRARAELALTAASADDVLPWIWRGLRTGTTTVRASCLRVLTRHSDIQLGPKQRTYLVSLAESGSAVVRRELIPLLRRKYPEDPSTRDTILRLLADPDRQVREEAEVSVGRLRPRPIEQVRLLAQQHERPEVRISALWGYVLSFPIAKNALRVDSAAAAFLVERMRSDSSAAVRQVARQLLQEFGP
ncbi:MAG: HEAT repeat domain-containing protein [Planctomycetota bacterium]|nr:HEAT repeat domain-containing protein [Planctomycetota bacterium]